MTGLTISDVAVVLGVSRLEVWRAIQRCNRRPDGQPRRGRKRTAPALRAHQDPAWDGSPWSPRWLIRPADLAEYQRRRSSTKVLDKNSTSVQ